MALLRPVVLFLFFFNDTATTEIYTLSLHDALPISLAQCRINDSACETSKSITAKIVAGFADRRPSALPSPKNNRSEEHTSELQSRLHLVCRLLLEKKKKKRIHRRLLQTSSPLRHLT